MKIQLSGSIIEDAYYKKVEDNLYKLIIQLKTSDEISLEMTPISDEECNDYGALYIALDTDKYEILPQIHTGGINPALIRKWNKKARQTLKNKKIFSAFYYGVNDFPMKPFILGIQLDNGKKGTIIPMSDDEFNDVGAWEVRFKGNKETTIIGRK